MPLPNEPARAAGSQTGTRPLYRESPFPHAQDGSDRPGAREEPARPT